MSRGDATIRRAPCHGAQACAERCHQMGEAPEEGMLCEDSDKEELRQRSQGGTMKVCGA